MEHGELYCSDESVVEEDGLIWKVALPVGELKLSPGYDGKPVHKPLRVIEGRSEDAKHAIGLQDLIDAFDEGAIQHVTVPTSHSDKPHENTGFVRKLRMGQTKDGRRALFTGIEFTEPDVKEKALRGTIANCSVGVTFDYKRKDSGKTYGAVLQHVALTNKPWVPGMESFGTALAEGDEIIPLAEVAPAKVTPGPQGSPGEPVPPGTDDAHPVTPEQDPPLPDKEKPKMTGWARLRGLWLRRQNLTDEAEKQGLEVIDFDNDFVIIADDEAKTIRQVPYDYTNDTLTVHHDDATDLPVEVAAEYRDYSKPADEPALPAPKATAVTPAEKLAASQADRIVRLSEAIANNNGAGGGVNMPDATNLSEAEATTLREENAELRKQLRKQDVATKIEALKILGLSETPGFLRVVQELLSADDGGPALNLSEDGKDVTLTVTDAINRMIDALPTKDGKITLSEQHINGGHPAPKETDEPLPVEDRSKAAREFLYNI